MKRRTWGAVMVVAVIAAGAGVLRWPGPPGAKPVFATENGAIDGYDPVGYFTEGRAVRGTPDFQMKWRGRIWSFANAEHLEAFRAGPEKYAPQYGGYCAYGMSEGYLADVDPAAWTVVDGKLYLNFDAGILEKWRATQQKRIEQADAHWAER